MTYYSEKIGEVLKELNTDPERGLSSGEALSRKEKYGENKLREKKKTTTLQSLRT